MKSGSGRAPLAQHSIPTQCIPLREGEMHVAVPFGRSFVCRCLVAGTFPGRPHCVSVGRRPPYLTSFRHQSTREFGHKGLYYAVHMFLSIPRACPLMIFQPGRLLRGRIEHSS